MIHFDRNQWLAGLDLARVVMESTGVFWKTVQRALAEARLRCLGCQRAPRQASAEMQDGCLRPSAAGAALVCYGLVSPSLPGGIRTRWGIAPCHGTPGESQLILSKPARRGPTPPRVRVPNASVLTQTVVAIDLTQIPRAV